MTLDRRRHRIDIALDQMISDDVSQLFKPELRAPLTLRLYVEWASEECSRTLKCDRCDDEQTVIVDVVDVAHYRVDVTSDQKAMFAEEWQPHVGWHDLFFY